MRHVDELKCKDIDELSTQMMSSMLDLTKRSVVWSNCSVLELHEFLRSGDADCLFNRPEPVVNLLNLRRRTTNLTYEETLEQFEQQTKFHAIYPGEQLYEIKSQCQQIFGPESDACDMHLEEDCRVLWCQVAAIEENQDSSVQCVTANTKWADGTRCGLNEPSVLKICMGGECVRKSEPEVAPRDGAWSAWSPFTKCSRACGGGVRKRFRACDSPAPRNGGKFCVGDRVLYESCNTHECLAPEHDFRDEQCRAAALHKVNAHKIIDQIGLPVNHTLLWKAYYSQGK